MPPPPPPQHCVLTNPHKDKSHCLKSGDHGDERSSAWSPAAGIVGSGLSVWLLTCHTDSTYARKNLGEFLFPSVGRMFTINSAIQVYRFHYMCQGIMNNPVCMNIPFCAKIKLIIFNSPFR